MNSSKEALSIGSDSKPPILYREEYEQWRMMFLILKRQLYGKHLVEPIEQGPMKPLYTEVPANPGAGRAEPERQLRSYENYTPQEKTRYDADETTQGYMIMSLTSDVLLKLDSYQNSAKEFWDQLEKIMQGSKVGNQLRITNIMDRYEKFHLKEGEKLDETYDRFVVLMNEMK